MKTKWKLFKTKQKIANGILVILGDLDFWCWRFFALTYINILVNEVEKHHFKVGYSLDW